jgi:hypothetical protein
MCKHWHRSAVHTAMLRPPFGVVMCQEMAVSVVSLARCPWCSARAQPPPGTHPTRINLTASCMPPLCNPLPALTNSQSRCCACCQAVMFADDTTVSKTMVKYACGITKESIVDVEGTVAVPAQPIDSATQKNVSTVRHQQAVVLNNRPGLLQVTKCRTLALGVPRARLCLRRHPHSLQEPASCVCSMLRSVGFLVNELLYGSEGPSKSVAAAFLRGLRQLCRLSSRCWLCML